MKKELHHSDNKTTARTQKVNKTKNLHLREIVNFSLNQQFSGDLHSIFRLNTTCQHLPRCLNATKYVLVNQPWY